MKRRDEALQLQEERDGLRQRIDVIDKQIETLTRDDQLKHLHALVGKYFKHSYGSSQEHYIFVIGVDEQYLHSLIIEVGIIRSEGKNGPWLSFETCSSYWKLDEDKGREITPSTKKEFDSVMKLIKKEIKAYT